MSATPSTLNRGLAVASAMALAAAGLTGCEKTTTTTQTPGGEVTTTTLSPSPAASEAIGRVNASLSAAASAIGSGSAASQALAKAGDAIEDGLITTKLKAALLADPDVKGLSIDVDTRNGAVTLKGTADKTENIDRVVRIARDTAGVKSVDNQLVVKAPG
ncbi:MAG: BON domain-containing protein [Caldimonas sp.]